MPEIDDQTFALVARHVFEVYSACQLCRGERLLVDSPIAATIARTPLGNPVTFVPGESLLYFPVSCQNCGYTVFFHGEAILRSGQ